MFLNPGKTPFFFFFPKPKTGLKVRSFSRVLRSSMQETVSVWLDVPACVNEL